MELESVIKSGSVSTGIIFITLQAKAATQSSATCENGILVSALTMLLLTPNEEDE